VAYVQSAHGGNGSAGTSLTASYVSGQTAAHLNVVWVTGKFASSPADPTVSDTPNGSYTKAIGPINYGSLYGWGFYKPNIASASSGNTVTVTFSSSFDYCEALVLEYSGMATSSPVDATGSSGNAGGGIAISVAVTTTNANDTVVTWFSDLDGDGWAGTPGTGFSNRWQDPGGWGSLGDDQTVTSTGTYTDAPTDVQTADALCIGIAFKASGGGGTFDPGPITGSIGVTGAVTPRFNPIRPHASGSIGVTGAVNVRIGSYSARGTAKVTGVVTPRLVKLPTASGSIGVSGITTPRLQKWTVRQSNFADVASSVTVNQLAFSSSVIAGNLLIVAFLEASGTNTVVSVADSVGTTYRPAVNKAVGGFASSWIYYGAAGGSGANTFTVTWTNNSFFPQIWLYEVIGSTLTNQLDQVSSATGSSATVTSGLTPATTSANEFLFGYLIPANNIIAGESGWTTTIDPAAGPATQYTVSGATGTYASTGTANASGTYIGLIATFLPGAGGNAPLRPGPLAGAFSWHNGPLFNWTNSGNSFSWTNGNPIISVTGIVTPRFPNQIRPHASGTIGVTGAVIVRIPKRVQVTGTIGVTGVVHGTLRIANDIFVTGVVTPRTVTRSPRTGFIKVTGVTTPRFTGVVRPFASGAIGVTGAVNVRFIGSGTFSPGASGSIGVTGTVNPEFITGRLFPTASGKASVSGVVIPRFILRPQASGLIRASGGLTNPRTIFRFPITGSISVSAVIFPRQYIYPRPRGSIGVTAFTQFELVGTLFPSASGNVTVSGVVTPRLNPLAPGAKGVVSVTGLVIPRYIPTGPKPPPVVIVAVTGYYAVLDAAGAYVVMYLLANVDYAFAIQTVISGPYDNYFSALLAIIQLEANLEA
jgi:hypothetical protein